jgi:hypothetical protein
MSFPWPVVVVFVVFTFPRSTDRCIPSVALSLRSGGFAVDRVGTCA